MRSHEPQILKWEQTWADPTRVVFMYCSHPARAQLDGSAD